MSPSFEIFREKVVYSSVISPVHHALKCGLWDAQEVRTTMTAAVCQASKCLLCLEASLLLFAQGRGNGRMADKNCSERGSGISCSLQTAVAVWG